MHPGMDEKRKYQEDRQMRKTQKLAAVFTAAAAIVLLGGCAAEYASAVTSAETSAETSGETEAETENEAEAEKETPAQEEREADQSQYPYVQRLEPSEPVDGQIGAAASMLDWGTVKDSPYFKEINYYDGTDISDTLVLLDHFQTYQQTSERSCGAASVLMVLNYLTGEAPGEDTLDKEMDIRYLDNVREDGSYGATTASVAEAFRKRGFEVQTSADTQDADGYSFYSEQELAQFMTDQLKAGHPVLMENVEWGGHWMVLIGYDNMGTPDIMLDDVVVFADSYDTSDHCQDGYYTMSFERYVSQWFDHQVMGENEKNQQYVAIIK